MHTKRFPKEKGRGSGFFTKEKRAKRGSPVCMLVFFLHRVNTRKAHKTLHAHLTGGDIRYDNDNISQRKTAKSTAIEKHPSIQPTMRIHIHSLIITFI